MKSRISFFIKFRLLLSSLLLLGLGGCEKTDDFYSQLKNQPEMLSNYKVSYQVGDTMTIEGRLNPENGLVIHIGDVDAKIISAEKIEFGVQMRATLIDKVKLIITPKMGVGSGRPVTVTSGGNTIHGNAIEIYTTGGYLDYPLKLTGYFTIPQNATVLFCRSGKGSVYLWQADKSIRRINNDGSTQTVLTEADCKDEYGNFKFLIFNGAGVDSREEYLYFSAITSDASPDYTNNTIFRICRFNLQTKELTTINRTLYPKKAVNRVLAITQPLEGNINAVKIFQATAFYPDSTGNIYIRMGNYATAKLSAGGQFRYLVKTSSGTIEYPKIWDETTGAILSNTALMAYLPGLEIAQQGNISPDEGRMYLFSNSGELLQYDINNQVSEFAYSRPLFTTNPTISGSFDNLTLGYSGLTNQLPNMFGLMPFGTQKLLILYYQGTGFPDFPAWGILDFATKRGDRYAPGALDVEGYNMQYDDILLNHDGEGMLYMTANHKTVLVKTVKQ